MAAGRIHRLYHSQHIQMHCGLRICQFIYSCNILRGVTEIPPIYELEPIRKPDIGSRERAPVAYGTEHMQHKFAQ